MHCNECLDQPTFVNIYQYLYCEFKKKGGKKREKKKKKSRFEEIGCLLNKYIWTGNSKIMLDWVNYQNEPIWIDFNFTILTIFFTVKVFEYRLRLVFLSRILSFGNFTEYFGRRRDVETAHNFTSRQGAKVKDICYSQKFTLLPSMPKLLLEDNDWCNSEASKENKQTLNIVFT